MSALDADPPQPPWFDAYRNVWVLSRYADVAAALREDRLSEWDIRYRDAASAAFSGPKLAEWRVAIQHRAESLIVDLPRPSDLVTGYARPLSAAAAELVTGATGDRAQKLARAVFDAAAEPLDAALQAQGRDATLELARQFGGGEMAPLYVQAYVALSESLPAFLGNSCYALLSHGERAHDALAIEELLRYAGPSKAQLRSGAVLMLASANRDPEVFLNPGTLQLTRTPNRHLAFGAGAHACLGAALIRMTATVALRVLFEAFPTMEIVEAQSREGFALRAIESLQALPSTTLHPVQR